MKVAEGIKNLNDLHVNTISRYFSKLRYFSNIHFCVEMNVS